MTPKEKARELVIEKFGSGYPIICKMDSRNMYRSEAKQCAWIAVDEFTEYLRWTQDYHLANYWREVKQEIELLW